MRPGIKKGQCCIDSVSSHPVLVISVQVADDKYYPVLEESLRRWLNSYTVFKIYGISLVNGSLKSFKVSKNSPARKITPGRAYLVRKELKVR